MNWLIVALLVGVSFGLLKVGNFKPNERYKQWLIPILVVVETFYFIYYYFKHADKIYEAFASFGLPLQLNLYIECFYVIICSLIILTTKQIIKGINPHDLLEKKFPNLNLLSNNGRYNDTYYYVPYVKNPIGVRPGVGYLSLFFGTATIVSILYVFVSLFLAKEYDIFMQSGLFAFSIPVFLEFYNYYNTDLQYTEEKEEVVKEEEEEEKPSTLMPLFNEYVQLFKDSFDLAFAEKNTIDPQNTETQNKFSFASLLEEFKRGKDVIVEDLDIPTSFHKLSDLFFESLTSGGNILILVDIPERHNKKQDGKDVSMMELFALHLSNYLQVNVPNATEILKVSYLPEKAGEDQFKSRIILASVSTVLDSNIQAIQWFNDLDLLLAINQSDKGRVSFLENQKFNLLIEQKNKTFRTVILSPFRQGLQTSMTRVWKLDRTCEKRIITTKTSKNHFCILANFESWHENWLTMATPLGTNLYSGVELSIPAINYGLNKVVYLEINNAEVREGREALGTSRNHITKYDLSRKNLDKIIEMNQLPFYMFADEAQQFSIIYDVENNSASMYNKWLHLGIEDNFSIIVSKPYLFKSYFADNMRLFKLAPMLAIEPIPSLSKVNLCILLYNILREGTVSEKQIKQILNDYDIALGHKPTPVFLRELFIRYFKFDIEENTRLQVEENIDFEKNSYVKTYSYSLAPFNINHFFQFMPLRKIKIVDNRGILRFTILKDMLFQNYLPRQKHIFNGRTFEISSYDDNEGVMTIRNLPQFNNHLFYYSCFVLSHQGKSLIGDIEDYISYTSHESDFSLLQFETPMKVDTPAYYEFRKSYAGITRTNNQEVLRIDLTSGEQNAVKRNYLNCRVMKLEWKLNKKMAEQIPTIQAGLHLLLFEAFRSFFPYSYQYLIVCSDRSQLNTKQQNEMAELPWIFPEFKSENNKDCVEIFIFEDSISDMGVLNAIRENYTYIFQYIYDYLQWLEEPAPKVSDKKTTSNKNYVNNVVDKLSFLKYGNSKLPSYLLVNELKDFGDMHFPLDKISKNELKKTRNKMK